MLRRNALLAVTAAATPLLIPATFAQAAEKAAGLSNAQYKTMTLNYGTLSLMTSLIARKKASDGSVRQFSIFEINEQTTAAQVLTNEKNPPPAPLTPDQEKIIAQLRSLSGSAFDKQYVKVQIEGHLALGKIQRTYIAHAESRDLLHIAMLVETVVGEHLTLLHNQQSSGTLGG